MAHCWDCPSRLAPGLTAGASAARMESQGSARSRSMAPWSGASRYAPRSANPSARICGSCDLHCRINAGHRNSSSSRCQLQVRACDQAVCCAVYLYWTCASNPCYRAYAVPGELEWKVAWCQGRQPHISRKRMTARPSLAGPASMRKGCKDSLYRCHSQSTSHSWDPTGSISSASSCVSSSAMECPSRPLPNLHQTCLFYTRDRSL